MTRKANEVNFYCWKIHDSARLYTVWKWRTGARCDIILKMRSAHLALLFHSCQIRLWHKQFLIWEDKRTNTISWLCWDSQPGLWIWIHMNLHLFSLLDPILHTECRSRCRRENECGSMWIQFHSLVVSPPTSVADPDPDPLRSEPFGQIWIRSNCMDPVPTI